MRFTIERLRTLVLVAGVLLVIALGLFLGTAKFRNRFIKRDIPHALGHGIQEVANDFVYTHFGPHGRVLYRIRASKQAQLKKEGKVFIQLHDVMIELYAEDGSRVDRIEGGEFEYNPSVGIAKAMGPVEITLMKPTVAPAIAPKAKAKSASEPKQVPDSLAAVAQTAASGEIHVKTSGLVFNRNTGEASTADKVEFSFTQGSGSAVGAKYAAQDGVLVLNRDVELSLDRPSKNQSAAIPSVEPGTEPMKMFARHAEFNRDEEACVLSAATVRYGADASSADIAKIYFRDDGSAERLDASGAFSMTTEAGGRLEAARGTLAFDSRNQPLQGRLDGGVQIDSENNGRKIHGTAPSMQLTFADRGSLRKAHLERGVQISSDEVQGTASTHRDWTSPVLEITFRESGKGRVQPASMHGTGGVIVTAYTQRGRGSASPEKLQAEEVTGEFGRDGALTGFTGREHALITQTTAAGVQQSITGDVLVAQLAPSQSGPVRGSARGGLQIEAARMDGHVILVQQPAPRRGVPQPEVRATAAHAEYGDGGQSLRLTGGPRVTEGGLEITADMLNVSQDSGDASAQGNVKATWVGEEKPGGAAKVSANFGAEGPVHVVAQEAELKRAGGSAMFKGNVRLWQAGNSISAPQVTLDRAKQTLAARTPNPKSPVQVVLVGAMALAPGESGKPKAGGPSVIKVTGGDLKYSGGERTAVMRAGVAGKVQATAAEVSTTSHEVELVMLPAGSHAAVGAAGQVDHMTSIGNVEVSSAGRHGFGEKLVYSNDTGDFVLTGTAAAPPHLTDPTHGTVTGRALIFNSRNDSVRIEGEGQKTTTVTTSPK